MGYVPFSAWAAVLLGLLAWPTVAYPQGVPPDSRWYTFETDHFRVSFEEGLEPLARRAAERAERAYRLLADTLLPPPSGRIEILVADNVDLSNGTASPFPRNRIVVYAQPPASEASLSYHDDWLELILIHELVHIFHFDFSDNLWEPLRRIFGREPLLFPQIYSPGWIVEGLGTFYESELTESGRVRGSIFEMFLRAAILEDAFFDIDQVTIDPITWPSTSSRYVYGSLFIAHLARRYGPASVAEFIRELGRRSIPYRLETSARRALGSTLSREWRLWEDSLRSEHTALADSLGRLGLTSPELLTRDGRAAHHPRFSPDGQRIAFTASTGRNDTGIFVLEPDGTVVTAVDRTSLGTLDWLNDRELIHDQLDYADPYRVYSDLFVGGPGRSRRQLTRNARVREPSVHPDGGTAVAVASAQGTNVLVSVDLASGEVRRLTEPDLNVYWSAPRWSPDGERIAVARWSPGGLYDIVVLDEEGEVVREVTRDRAVDSQPAWSPDGRYLLFSSDRTGIPNLYAYDREAGMLWQVTNVLTGAFEPDVSPDGRWIAFSYYLADGYHIARIPFDPAGWRVVEEERVARPPGRADLLELDAVAGGPARRYSPIPTVLPTSWSIRLASDDLGFGAGVGIFGRDVIDRHFWSVELLGYPEDGRLGAGALYRYRGLGRPVITLRAEQDWDVQAVSGSGADALPSDVLRRDREAEIGLSWTFPSWWSNVAFSTGLDLRDLDFSWRDEKAGEGTALRTYPLDLGANVSLGYSNVRSFALSLGPQEGYLASARMEARRYLDSPEWDPSSRDYWRATGRGLAFLGIDWFGFAPPIAALRVEGGVEGSSSTPGFALGGARGADVGIQFADGDVDYPLRGFPRGVQRGNRVVSASAEYRFPLALIERGLGLLPLGVKRLWGDVFLDAGTAWCAGACTSPTLRTPLEPDPLVSAGIEAILDITAGYLVDLPLRAGIAFPVRSSDGRSPEVYLRVGASF